MFVFPLQSSTRHLRRALPSWWRRWGRWFPLASWSDHLHWCLIWGRWRRRAGCRGAALTGVSGWGQRVFRILDSSEEEEHPRLESSGRDSTRPEDWGFPGWQETRRGNIKLSVIADKTTLQNPQNSFPVSWLVDINLCSGQQWLHFFVVFNGNIKRLEEIRHHWIDDFFCGLIFLMNDLQQATFLYGAWRDMSNITSHHLNQCRREQNSSSRCFTVKRVAVRAYGLLPAFVRDLLLEAALLQVRQSRSTQVIQKLKLFLFGEKDVRTRLTDHLNEREYK